VAVHSDSRHETVLADFEHAKTVSHCRHDTSHLRPLDADRLAEFLVQRTGWSLRAGRLRRRLDFPDFDSTMRFVEAAAELSRRTNHHPDVYIENKRTVFVVLWTHKAGCLTELDLDYADAVEAFAPGPSEVSA
jgi:4a-hydroxytetrahydrobiopterin dehydratase